jgi:hypothetical protein
MAFSEKVAIGKDRKVIGFGSSAHPKPAKERKKTG